MKEKYKANFIKNILPSLPIDFLPAWIDKFFLILIYCVLTHQIGLKDVGYISIILGVNFCFSAFFDMGVSEATANLVSMHIKDTPKLNGILYKTYLIVVCQIFFSSAFLFTISPLLSKYVFHQNITFLLRCSVLWIPPIFLMRYYNALFKGLRNARFLHFPVLVLEMMKVEVLVIAYSFQKGISFIINGWTVCYAISGGFYFFLVHSSLFKKDKRMEEENMPTKEILKEAFRVSGASFFRVSEYWLFVLVAALFFSPKNLGCFAICCQLTGFSFFCLSPFSQASCISLFNSCRQNDVEKIKDLFSLNIKYVGFLGYIILTLWLFFGKYILDIFSHSLAQHSNLVHLLALGMFFNVFALLSNPMLDILGEQRVIKWLEYGKWILFLAASYFVLPKLSVFGAGIVISGIFIFETAFKLVTIEKKIPLGLEEKLKPFIWLPVILTPLYFINAPFIIFIGLLFYWLITQQPFLSKEYKQCIGT